jgi:glucokinase
MNEMHAGDWLLVEIDGNNVSFGLAKPSQIPSIHSLKTYESENFTTATDCFSQYAIDAGIDLRDRQCAMSVSGPLNGDNIRIQRCRWIISITGLSYLTGSRPIMVNLSVGKSWISVSPEASKFPKIGGEAVRIGDVLLSKTGKLTSINYNRGLSAAVLHRTEAGVLMASDGECGHIGFAPQNEIELEIYSTLAKTQSRITYEHILFLGPTDPVWDKLSKPIGSNDRERLRAGILGSFAGDLALAFGSWAGVLLHGEKSQFLSNSEFASLFNSRFEAKANFATNVRNVPRYLAGSAASGLAGLAQMMASTHPD